VPPLPALPALLALPALPAIFAATIAGDLGTLVAQAIFAFMLLLVALWGQISYGNRALKMGQDIAFGFFAVFVWFIGMSQLISGRISGLALVIVTILMGTALFDPIRRVTWARLLPIVADDRMHMLGLVCLLFATAIFFLTSASVAAPIGTPVDRASVYDPAAKGTSAGWGAFDPLPAPRKGLGLVAIKGTLYAIGGEDAKGPVGTIQVNTPRADGMTGTWADKASLPNPRAHAAIAAAGGKIYVVGGDRDGVPVNTVSVYDPATDTWADAPPLPAPRASASAAMMGITDASDDRLFVIGGTAEDPNGAHPHATNTVYVFDPVMRQWTTFASLHTARMGAAATGDNGRVFVLGGQDAGRSLASAETLDPQAATWITLPNMPEARANPGAAVIGLTVYVVGGVSTAEATATTYVLDFVANRWAQGPELTTGRSGLGIVASGGKLYAAGGATDQLAQIVPTGGVLFTVGEAMVVAALAVLLVGVGVRRVPRPVAAKAVLAGAAAGGGRRINNRGVIASSLDDAGEKLQYGTSFRWRRSAAEIRERLGLTAPTPRVLLVALATVVALVIVTIGGQALTTALSPTIAANVVRIAAQAQENIGGAAAAAVAAVLLAAGEEVLFRGAIQPRYGIFLTALAFAALHTQYGFAVAPLTVFAVGLVLGLARRFGSTTSAILANVLYVIVMLALVRMGVYAG